MVNGPRRIFVERRGRTEASEVVFEDDAHVLRVLRRMLAPVNRRCDVTSPMVDARLPDGSRINAVIAPLAITGPTITIRKFAHDPYTIEMLIANDTLSSDMAAFVKAAVQSRLNVVVAGGTGSGKTTTLNAISAFIPDTDRIVTIEDTAELQLQQDHIVALESRPANLEGAGQITIRELVRNALHMRPERIIVGECRGGEALDMLQAMATGQSGSLTTAHSNTPKEMITRLEVMVMMAGTGLSMASIREQIAATVDIIVQQERFRDGSRRVTRISEVDGIAPNGEVALHDVFVFEVRGIDAMGKIVGSFKPTGYVPRCLTLFRAGSFQLPDTMFGDGTSVEREYGRIERQRQIEEQRERNLESMRFRGESTVRARRGPTPLTASAVSDELARRKRQRVSLADRVGDGATPEGAPLPDASQPPEEHLLAVELRQRMAEKPPEQDPAVTSPFAQHLDQMGQAPDGAPPAAEGQDLTGHLRSRLPADTALLRRLKKSEKK
ncbi:MAG: CpaF family protein [Candidatus Riflebacteria bacterium]|nr:CpaF family protein [Candidatus Riflebacteria bacterium]